MPESARAQLPRHDCRAGHARCARVRAGFCGDGFPGCSSVQQLDHRLLNDVKGLENPTAEIIAAWFLNQIPDVESVRVYENDDCWAEVTR